MDGRRVTQATSTCCVSFSAFNNEKIAPCPTCACECQRPETCVGAASLVQCTSHMCPIHVHWHVTVNDKEDWRVKIAVTNFNYRLNYNQWNLVILNPNLKNLTQVFSFSYKPLTPYGIYETAMFWGIKFYNDMLFQAGPLGTVQSELLFRKDKSTSTLQKGWAFPKIIIFNGDRCIMPPSDAYPYLPNASWCQDIGLVILAIILLAVGICVITLFASAGSQGTWPSRALGSRLGLCPKRRKYW